MASFNQPSKNITQASDFYLACKSGDLTLVDRYLKTMTARQVNRVEESNNSTALHAASFYGHKDVVKRLLEIGASKHTRNGFGNTPEQEASTPEIKDLFKGFD